MDYIYQKLAEKYNTTVDTVIYIVSSFRSNGFNRIQMIEKLAKKIALRKKRKKLLEKITDNDFVLILKELNDSISK